MVTRRADDRTTISALLGTPVVNEDGTRVGQVGDLVVDLGVDLDRVAIGCSGCCSSRPWHSWCSTTWVRAWGW